MSAIPRVGPRTDVPPGRTCIQQPTRTDNPKERPTWGVITIHVLCVGSRMQPWRWRCTWMAHDGRVATCAWKRGVRGWNEARACARSTIPCVWDGVGATRYLCFDRLRVGRRNRLERDRIAMWNRSLRRNGDRISTTEQHGFLVPRLLLPFQACTASTVPPTHPLHPCCEIRTVSSISKVHVSLWSEERCPSMSFAFGSFLNWCGPRTETSKEKTGPNRT